MGTQATQAPNMNYPGEDGGPAMTSEYADGRNRGWQAGIEAAALVAESLKILVHGVEQSVSPADIARVIRGQVNPPWTAPGREARK